MMSDLRRMGIQCAAALTLLVLTACSKGEPEVNGKTMSQWILIASGPSPVGAEGIDLARQDAFTALKLIGEPAVPALTRMVTDPSEPVSAGAAGALALMGPPAKPALPTLLGELRNRTDQQSRSAIVMGLSTIDPTSEEAQVAMVSVLTDEDGMIRKLAQAGLTKCFKNGHTTEGARRALMKLRETNSDAAAQEVIESLLSAAGVSY